MRTVFITGVNGQDGSYLSELHLERGDKVVGFIRRSSTTTTERIAHLLEDPHFSLIEGDVTDSHSVESVIKKVRPDYIYNMAAMSHVQASFELAASTIQIDSLGCLNVLNAMKDHCPNAKFYQASTSELFGGLAYNMPEAGYNETSLMHPRSPYGCAKLCALWLTRNFKESYNLFACNGILHNHEGERRGEKFVTRKITIALSKMEAGLQDTLKIGNLNAFRDWGYAKDFCRAMTMMLDNKEPVDYVVATGETHSVREFIEEASKYTSFEIEWRGTGIDEKGYDRNTGRVLVEVDPQFFRAAEVNKLKGDYSKIYRELGWAPTVSFKQLVGIMMNHDLHLAMTKPEKLP